MLSCGSYCLTSCSAGTFEEHGHCFQCHASCKLCDEYDSCIECNEGYVDTGGQLCEYRDCEYGKFFSTPLNSCEECGDSCRTLCAYQSHCFGCSLDEILNLRDMTCVDQCDPESQIMINDTQLQSIPICRDFEYYVNANSQSPVELGTEQHPYKDIQSAFTEIMNFHSHSERNVTVYVLEETTVFASSPTYFVNMTHVQMEAYNDGSSIRRLARMVGVIEKSKIISPAMPTKFRILENHTLLHNKMLFDNPGFDSDDKAQLLIENAVFKPFHAGLLIKHFRLTTQYDDPGTAHAILEPYRADTRVVGMMDCDLRIQGTILRAITIVFNWHMENIIFETQHLYRLSLTRLRCAADGTDMGTRVYFKNVTSINSGGKAPYLHNQQSLTRNYLANNAHFEDCNFDTYLGFDIEIIQFILYVYPLNCGEQPHKMWNFTNFHLKTSRNEPGKNSNFSQTNDIAFCRLPDPQRDLTVYVNNFTVENDYNNKFGHLIAWYAYNTTFYINGANFYNSSGWMINIIASKNVTINDVLFENVDLDSPNLSYVLAKNKATFDGVVLRNVTDTKVYSNPLFQNVITGDAEVAFANSEFINTTILDRRAVFYASASSKSTFLVENILTQNLLLYGDTALIGYGVFKEINFTNIYAYRTYSYDGGSNFLINSDYSSEGLAPDNVQIFKDIVVEQSSVSVISVTKPDAFVNATQSLSISNVTYKDSSLIYEIDLIWIYKMATVGSYSIEMNQITFKNLTFQLVSRLMHLQQQLKSQITITNLTVTNVVHAGITVQAFESNDFYNKTHVKFVNMKATNFDGRSRSLINIYRGADIEIVNSEFSFIGNYDKGSVLSAGKERAIATLRNCTFFNNTSIEGGVFETQAESNVKCYNCTFYNNFAIAGGVVKINGDGSFEFYNATIYNNVAMNGAITELFSSQQQSIVDSSNITMNYGVSREQVLNEIIQQTYIFESFRDYITTHIYILDDNPTQINFKIIMGIFLISNCHFTDIPGLMHTTGSRLTINDSIFKNVNFEGHFFGISESDISMTNNTFTNITCTSNEIFHFVNAYFEVDTLTYTNSNCRFINSGLSQLNLKNVDIYNLTLSLSLMSIFSSFATARNNEGTLVPTSMISCSFKDINVTSTELIIVKNSNISDINHTEFTQIVTQGVESQVMKIVNSEITHFTNVTLRRNKRCLYAAKSTIRSIHSSRFEECGEADTLAGGALKLVDSDSVVFNSSFSYNSAKVGASVSVECNFARVCRNVFKELVIQHNVAAEMGGGIYYDLYRPETDRIEYFNNSAQYGPDIASYPVRIVQSSTTNNKVYLDDIPSGLKYETPLSFDLVDFDGQVMNLINSVNIKILTNDSNLSVRGSDFAVTKNGTATFDNLIFIGETGMKNKTFRLTSVKLDQQIINQVLDNSDKKYTNFIDISFRYCKPGEIETTLKQCDPCEFRTYTFEWNSTECLPCMDYATCMGETHIDVDEGYWRKSANSSLIIECLNRDACLGNFHPENEGSPTQCKSGYRGYLCTQCDIVDNIKYQPLADFQCSKCPSPALNMFRIIFVATFAFLFLLLLIYINLRKTKESRMSILLRILTNYIHLITVSLSFNVRIPTNFTSMFSFMNRISSPNETFFSFDCFVNDYEIKLYAPSNNLFKTSLFIFLPVILISAITALFGCIKLVHFIIFLVKRDCFGKGVIRTNLFNFKRSLVVSMICIVFLFHPAFTVKSLSMLLCTRIDENDSRMTYHMEYTCYSWNHIKWVLVISVPLLVIWVIGLPMVALWILIKYRHKLDRPEMQSYFLILYQGFRQKTFYWEFVNSFKKFAILAIIAFLNTFPAAYKIFVSVISLLIFYRFQSNMKPFKYDPYNRLDLVSLTVAIITIFSSIVFVLGYKGSFNLHMVVLLFIFGANLYFLLRWLYLVMILLKWKNSWYLCLLKTLRIVIAEKVYYGLEDENSEHGNVFGKDMGMQAKIKKRRVLVSKKNKMRKKAFKKRKKKTVNRRYKHPVHGKFFQLLL
ncbi:unnamed protein product [Moneuplotes crassus]|uniref:Uncharacterized protein n=1 Tax=Euplotes crassus TaxID=5936 RepID=A0AAD1ULW8_EUPCR|nr:unnamed protein product [Moneuplotes crassus]